MAAIVVSMFITPPPPPPASPTSVLIYPPLHRWTATGKGGNDARSGGRDRTERDGPCCGPCPSLWTSPCWDHHCGWFTFVFVVVLTIIIITIVIIIIIPVVIMIMIMIIIIIIIMIIIIIIIIVVVTIISSSSSSSNSSSGSSSRSSSNNSSSSCCSITASTEATYSLLLPLVALCLLDFLLYNVGYVPLKLTTLASNHLSLFSKETNNNKNQRWKSQNRTRQGQKQTH